MCFPMNFAKSFRTPVQRTPVNGFLVSHFGYLLRALLQVDAKSNSFTGMEGSEQ